MSMIGDPPTDLAWLLAHWRDADDAECAILELVITFTDREGYPRSPNSSTGTADDGPHV